MKYTVVTHGHTNEVWDGEARMRHVEGSFAATGALICESGVIIPWHEVRRLVPVVEPKAEAHHWVPSKPRGPISAHKFNRSQVIGEFEMNLCADCGHPGREHVTEGYAP